MPQHALIIEDEILIALEVEQVLSELGFATFDWADNPASAVACARLRRPDLVTADIRIVDGTGIEAVRAIHDELGLVPVIYITANADLLRHEPSAVVVQKPIQQHDMMAALRAVG